MNILACAVIGAIAATGCAIDDGDDYAIQPGGDPPSVGSASGGETFAGRVCVLSDLQDFASCSTTAGGDLVVTLGDNAAVTADDGTFEIDVPFTPLGSLPPQFRVTGAGVLPTNIGFDDPTISSRAIPVIDQALFNELLATNGVTLDPGMGSILATVTANGLPATGVTAATTPVSAFGPFYDASTPEQWAFTATGERGVVWIPGLAAGTANLTFTSDVGATTLVAGIQVRNGGVTVLSTPFPTLL